MVVANAIAPGQAQAQGMKQAIARQSERVDYRVPVELCSQAGEAAARSLICHTLNVGVGGMAVCGRIPLAVGAPVECRMVLDGEARSLPGRVAWTTDTGPSEDSCAGIRFERLTSADSSTLEVVVSAALRFQSGEPSEDLEPVWLYFEGVDEPVRVRAAAHGDGLRIRAALPLLAKYAPVRFRRSGGEPNGEFVDAYVGDVSMTQNGGTPELCLHIERAKPRRHRKRSRRHAMYGDRAQLHSQLTPSAVGGERRSTALIWTGAARARGEHGQRSTRGSFSAPPRKRAERPTTREWLGLRLGPLLLGVSLVTIGWAWQRDANNVVQDAEVVVEQDGATAPKHLVGTQTDSETHLPGHVEPPGDVLVDEDVANTRPTSDASEPAVALPRLEPTPETAANVPLAQHPQVSVGPGFTRVWFPLVGNMREITVHKWKEPLAIAISLPHGMVALEGNVHRVERGGVGRVIVSARDGVGLVRVMLTRPVRDYEAVPFHGGMEVQLEHALHGGDVSEPRDPDRNTRPEVVDQDL